MEIWTNDGIIVQCKILGKCHGNLRVLAESLIGESVYDADVDVTCCGNHGQDCAFNLKNAVLNVLSTYKKKDGE